MRKSTFFLKLGSIILFVGNIAMAQMQVKNSASTVLFNITQSGNVGIGIGDATPAARLHSDGTVRLAGSLGTATTADMNVLIRQTDGDLMPRALAANVWDGDNQQLSISGNTLSLTDGGSVPLPLGIGGSGVATRVSFWNTTSTLGSDANLFWDNNNDRLGIGTTAPQAALHSTGTLRLSGALGTATTADMNVLIRQTDGDVMPRALAANVWDGDNQQLSISGTTLSLTDGGSVTLPLGVGGSGVATRVAFWNTGSTLSSDAALYWNNSNKRLGIGATSPQATLHSLGTVRLEGTLGTATTADMNVLIRQSDGDVMPRALGADVWDGDNQTLSISGNNLSISGGNTVTLPTWIDGSGAATRVAFWQDANTITSNSALYWNNSSLRLGVGTSTPGYGLDVVSNRSGDWAAKISNSATNGSVISLAGQNNGLLVDMTSTSGYALKIGRPSSEYTPYLYISGTDGKVGIGTTNITASGQPHVTIQDRNGYGELMLRDIEPTSYVQDWYFDIHSYGHDLLPPDTQSGYLAIFTVSSSNSTLLFLNNGTGAMNEWLEGSMVIGGALATSSFSERLNVGGRILVSDKNPPPAPSAGVLVIYSDGINLYCKNSSGATSKMTNF